MRPADTRIRIAVADDDALVRDAIVRLINDDEAMTVVATACDTDSAVAVATDALPDVVLLDVRMPGGGGAVAAHRIREASPDTRIVALSAYGDSATVLRVIEAGACGYIVKGTDPAELLNDIRTAACGGAPLSPEAGTTVVSALAAQLQDDRHERDLIADRRRVVEDFIDGRGVRPIFQPIVDLAAPGGATVGFEALSRFDHPSHRGPDFWFAEAAALGCAERLDLRAMALAAAHFPAEGTGGTFLSLNCAGATLALPDLVAFAASLTVPLVLEVTEHEPIANYAVAMRALEELRGHGVRLAVDDAGEGFSSLRHILHLQPEIIKIDRSLISAIDCRREQQSGTRAIVGLARELGAITVAEGIETAGELEVVRALGVDWGQGFLLGRPQPEPVL